MRCKFRKICSYFRKENRTCTRDGGMYYGPGRPAGCYRKMEDGKRRRE